MPSAAEALEQVIAERLGALDVSAARSARNPALVPVAMLGHLAWSRGLDYWDPSWPVSVRRQLAAIAPANRRIRGTRQAIDNAMAAFAADLLVEEWFEQTPEGEPGTARATIFMGTALGSSAEDQATVNRLLAREGRKSIHWELIVGVAGIDGVATKGSARVTLLSQHSGVQGGA